MAPPLIQEKQRDEHRETDKYTLDLKSVKDRETEIHDRERER